MVSSLRDDYEAYKKLPLLLQIVRMSNAMFATFTFWNLALRNQSVYGISKTIEDRPIYAVSVLLIGMLFNGLILVRVKDSFQKYLLFPLAGSFYISTPSNQLLLLLLIPLAAFAILISCQIIIRLADMINRF